MINVKYHGKNKAGCSGSGELMIEGVVILQRDWAKLNSLCRALYTNDERAISLSGKGHFRQRDYKGKGPDVGSSSMTTKETGPKQSEGDGKRQKRWEVGETGFENMKGQFRMW